MRYIIQELIDPRTGEGVATSILKGLGDAALAKFDTRLLYLRDQPPSGWREPQAKRLSAENEPQCKNIYEIRFSAQRVQQRPLGYFESNSNTFTIVIWTTHKGKQWKPRDYCRIANERWNGFQQGIYESREIEID